MKISENQKVTAQLVPKLSEYAHKAFQYLLSIGEEGFELISALLVMIMVERSVGQQGLGIYAYLTACLYALRYLANFGITGHAERETALLEPGPRQQRLIAASFQASMATGLGAGILVLLTAGFDASHTQVQERTAAYFIIAALIPLANLNNLKLAILQGRGDHGRVARLRMLRHGLILGGMFAITRIQVPPSFLLVVFLPADLVMAVRLRRHLKMPRLRTVFTKSRNVLGTLNRGKAYLFTDNALDLMLNIDLFVLGLFVSGWELGVYAEAAVLVRFFLIIPVGARPILRRAYVRMACTDHCLALARRMRHNQAILFSLTAVGALHVLLCFPAILEFFFGTRLGAGQAFQLFTFILPGLVFYGPLSAQEPIYEAFDQVDRLRRLTLTTAAVNFFLTIYLVPAAGTSGAAAATMLTMLFYTGLFGRGLEAMPSLHKPTYLVAGLGVYLVYKLLQWAAWGTAIDVWAGPAMIGLLFYACGIYGVMSREDSAPGASARA